MTPPDSPWTPDDDDGSWSPSPDREDGGGKAEAPPVLQAVLNPMPLAQRAIEHERAESGITAVATYLAERGADSRPIAIHGFPTAFAEALLASHLFDEPTPLVASAWSREEGIQVILQALVPQDALRALERSIRAADEPWLASAGDDPSFDDGRGAEERELEPAVPFPLGVLWRYKANFVAEGDVEKELVDLLVRVLGGEGTDAKTKEIENFLRDSGLGF